MKKFISLMLVMACLCLTLTGCINTMGTVKLNEDGSGSMEMYLGIEKEIYTAFSEMEDVEQTSGTALNDLQEFTYNGVTYLGKTEKKDFQTINELNLMLSSNLEETSENFVDAGVFKFTQEKGSFTLTFNTTPETGDVTDLKEEMSLEMDAKTVKAIMDSMVMTFTFDFPYNVTQISGNQAGVNINGSKLTLDVLKMTNVVPTTYVFTSSGGSSASPNTSSNLPPNTTQGFTDVLSNAWYYTAVMTMEKGGLVNGTGNNLFNPEGNLTYAQFCQILSRAKGLTTGTDTNGYWAGLAIEACVKNGYVLSRGETAPKNYDVSITREAAISAMYLAKQASLFLPLYNYTIEMIPDYNSISTAYRENIIQAYNYGITNGIDESRTLSPKGLLTRAQVCQLFYNLEWTNPLLDV